MRFCVRFVRTVRGGVSVTRLFSVLGDSISTFEGSTREGFAVFYAGERRRAWGVESVEDTWWMQVVSRCGGTVASNAAWSGSCVEGPGYPAGESPGRADALVADDGSAPDDILVFFGTNDYGWGGFSNQMRGRGNAIPFCAREDPSEGASDEKGGEPCGASASFPAVEHAVERFQAAYGRMLSNLRSRFPRARIWCVSLLAGRVSGCGQSTFPRVYRGAAFDDYNAAIESACRDHGCTFCRASSLGYDYEALDGTHPTKLGMSQIAWMVETCMREAGDAALSELDASPFPGKAAFLSRDPCVFPGRSCVNCAYAQSTTAQWMHVCRRFIESGPYRR